MKLLFAILFFYSANASFLVQEIEILGNSQTKDYVIKNELNFNIQQSINKSDLDKAEQALRNTNLFSDVKIENQSGKIVVNVKEKWTTIPIFKVSSGGGVRQYTAGVYDPNVLGHFVEIGSFYQRLEDTHSGVLWFKHPRLFKKYSIDIQGWKTNRVRIKYDQKVDEVVEKNYFLHSRDKFYFALKSMISNSFNGLFSYEYNNDSFSERYIPAIFDQKSITVTLPPATEIHFFGVGFELGKIDINNYKLDGSLLSFKSRYGLVTNKNIDGFIDGELSWQYYKSFSRYTFAQRFLTGGTNTNLLQYWKYFGGLHHVRGFLDNRFSGKYFWLSNSEYRIKLFESPTWIFQGNSFMDLISISERAKNLSHLSAASVGLGGRVILPKVYRFVLRLDYAKSLKKEGANNISFGVQQFF